MMIGFFLFGLLAFGSRNGENYYVKFGRIFDGFFFWQLLLARFEFQMLNDILLNSRFQDKWIDGNI